MQLQGELVQLAIGGLPLRDVLLALDEGRRIENHDIETLARSCMARQRIERVLARRLHLHCRSPQRCAAHTPARASEESTQRRERRAVLQAQSTAHAPT